MFLIKFFKFLAYAILWLWVFIVSAGLFFFLGFLLYHKSVDYLFISIIVTILGVVLGIWLAEFIRKKYGLDYFFGKLLSTPELEEDDNTKNESKSTR